MKKPLSLKISTTLSVLVAAIAFAHTFLRRNSRAVEAYLDQMHAAS